MKLPTPTVNRIVKGFNGAELGDPRRSRRLAQVVRKLARRPSVSLPAAMETEAELEAAYRLVNNPRVTMAALVEGHAGETARRAKRLRETVLAIHDTTSCQFAHADPTELGYLHTGKPGFYAHYTLVVEPAGRTPLGICHLETISRRKKPQRRNRKRSPKRRACVSRTRKKAREYERWQRGIDQTESVLAGCQPLHVADRATDSYELMAHCVQSNYRFVFRVASRRRTARVSDETIPVCELAAAQTGRFTREVQLSSRAKKSPPRCSKAFPPRKRRRAELQFSATTVTLCRPHYLDTTPPDSLDVNLVRVWEPNPPQDEKPVEWLLYTSEQVDTPDQIAQVVDAYRLRWLIEECNKALKSGCLYEKRYFESRAALETLLAMSLPIACEILALRSAAEREPNRPASSLLSTLQIRVLRRRGSRRLAPEPTVADAVLAIAALGGHQRSNGPPGWLVLQRGMEQLLAFERGWRAAREQPADL